MLIIIFYLLLEGFGFNFFNLLLWGTADVGYKLRWYHLVKKCVYIGDNTKNRWEQIKLYKSSQSNQI